MIFRVQTKAQIWQYTALISAISIAVPVCVVGIVLSFVPNLPLAGIVLGLSIAFFIPLFIAPPLSFLVMVMLRMQNKTIRAMDEHMRFDLLTGVLNRGHFLDRIRSKAASGVLMIVDADHFKQVNDKLGHAAGDEALSILAQTMHNAVGSRGIVGRLGGEEFGIFLPDANLEFAEEFADSLCRSVRQLDLIVDGKPLRMTISVGGTIHHRNSTIGHSLKVADERLYAAKRAGRDRCNMVGRSPDLPQSLSA